MVSKKHAKELLRNSGHWVLIHSSRGNYGHFKKPDLKNGSITAFQECVESYARKLALASNMVALDGAERYNFEGGTFGQRFRSGREEELILPGDVRCAARALETGDISIDSDLKVIKPGPCIHCGNVPDRLELGRFGLVCVHCHHIIRPLTMSHEEGDPDTVEVV